MTWKPVIHLCDDADYFTHPVVQHPEPPVILLRSQHRRSQSSLGPRPPMRREKNSQLCNWDKCDT